MNSVYRGRDRTKKSLPRRFYNRKNIAKNCNNLQANINFKVILRYCHHFHNS